MFEEWFKSLFAVAEPVKNDPESRALAHMLDRVTNGDLIFNDDLHSTYFGLSTKLDRYGISRMVVNSQFGILKISWFTHANSVSLMDIYIDGKAFPYSTNASEKLLKAAAQRAEGLLEEELARLDRKLDEQP